MPGSFSSTLDTNKYKFLTKIPLDDLEIVKCECEQQFFILFNTLCVYFYIVVIKVKMTSNSHDKLIID